MSDYDHLRAYLHSRTLRWSYGAIKGRHGDGRQRTIAKLPADEMVHALQSAGFEGIYLDRYGYEDNGAGIEKKLTRLLGQPLLVSPNKRWCFFKLSRYEPPADIATAFRNPN